MIFVRLVLDRARPHSQLIRILIVGGSPPPGHLASTFERHIVVLLQAWTVHFVTLAIIAINARSGAEAQNRGLRELSKGWYVRKRLAGALY
jgi:hypothetical protein